MASGISRIRNQGHWLLGGAVALALLLTGPVAAAAAPHGQENARVVAVSAPVAMPTQVAAADLSFAGQPLDSVALRQEHGRGETVLSNAGRKSMEQAGIVLWDEGRPAGGGHSSAYSSSAGANNVQANTFVGSQ